MPKSINNSLETKIKSICEEVLKKVTPSEKERAETLKFSRFLVEALKKELSADGISAEVQIEGSVAKDTWLAGEKDIDIFVLLPPEYGRDVFPRVLNAAKRISGENYLEAYAEHPYIEAYIDGFNINFVPCFMVKSPEEAKSSVDRTPFHTQYINSKMNDVLKNEIRLLKAFMHGISVYGAEIKVGGFSGYLCELLVLYYGSFIGILRAASKWHRGEVIDIERYYRSPNEAKRIFQNEPLIVVDPVDKGRNVASAVRINRLSEFILASRLFLKNPSIKFFNPKIIEPYSADDLLKVMSERGSAIIFIKTGTIKAAPDILWGQLFRSQRALLNLIKHLNFEVLRSDVWSDEKSSNMIIFELSSRFLPPIERHVGPPIDKIDNCEVFLKKHLGSKNVFSGPRIEGDRLVVEKRRRYTDIVKLLKDNLASGGGRGIGVARLVAKAFSESLEVLVNEEILDFYSSNIDFARFLTEYLVGRPRWLL
ncbi:MAG: CCA tRNA nucleotidyltransferase [Candidatus Bathyarchaeia archaeon]